MFLRFYVIDEPLYLIIHISLSNTREYTKAIEGDIYFGLKTDGVPIVVRNLVLIFRIEVGESYPFEWLEILVVGTHVNEFGFIFDSFLDEGSLQ